MDIELSFVEEGWSTSHIALRFPGTWKLTAGLRSQLVNAIKLTHEGFIGFRAFPISLDALGAAVVIIGPTLALDIILGTLTVNGFVRQYCDDATYLLVAGISTA